MNEPVKCPVCYSTSLKFGGETYLLVNPKELEIDCYRMDLDNLEFSLTLSGSVTKWECLDCSRIFYT